MTLDLASVRQQIDRQRPIQLEDLIQFLYGAGHYEWFMNLVNTYLPSHAHRILASETIAQAIEAFAEQFSEDVFPLDLFYIAMNLDAINDWQDEDEDAAEHDKPQSMLAGLRQAIPVQLQGIDLNDVHDLWRHQPTAVALLATLPCSEAIVGYASRGLRPSWLDMASQHVSEELLLRMPPEGYQLDHLLHAAGQSTDPDTTVAIRWVLQETDNRIMDLYHDYEMVPFYVDEWTQENIEQTREIWEQARPMQQALERYLNRVAEDPEGEIASLIDLIERNPAPTTTDSQNQAADQPNQPTGMESSC